jgi:hypothetical protein
LQLPQERDEATYPETVWFRTKFEIDEMPNRLALLIDGFSGKSHQLFINGEEVKDKGKRSKLDAEIKEVDVKNFVKKGINTVAVKLVVTRRTDGMLDLLKLVGDFSLVKKKTGYAIGELTTKIKIGDWTKQGYPCYSGTGVYKQSFEATKKYLDGKLFLQLECGEDVAEVSVNGSYPIVMPWHPYKADITQFVKEGKNKIEIKVTNTLINILEAVEKESGLFTEPVIEHANRYEISI